MAKLIITGDEKQLSKIAKESRLRAKRHDLNLEMIVEKAVTKKVSAKEDKKALIKKQSNKKE